jgi:hypothetical protein
MKVQPNRQQPDGRKLSGGAIASLTGVGVLLVFIIQNTYRVRFQFFSEPSPGRCGGIPPFRHTFATWLEDAGIPARVIDEVMGHEATSRAGQQRGSAMGAHYRHTTPEMAARIATAIEQRLTVVLKAAEQALEAQPRRSSQRVF